MHSSYSRTSMAQTLMACLPCLTRNRYCTLMVQYTKLLLSKLFYAVVFSFSILSDLWSLKIENENNKKKTLTAEVKRPQRSAFSSCYL